MPGTALGTLRVQRRSASEFYPWVSPPALSLTLGKTCALQEARPRGSSGPKSLSCLSADGIYEIGGLFPVWAVVVIVGTALAAVTFFATSNSEPPRFHWVRISGAPGWDEGTLESSRKMCVRAPWGS